MDKPVLVGAAIVILGAVYVLPLVVLEAWERFRRSRVVTCPETGLPASVGVDAGHAAMTAAWGRPDLRIAACSRWPERAGCDQRCLVEMRRA